MKRTASIAFLAACLSTAIGLAATAQPAATAALAYGADGKLIAPADYRDWIFLSSGLDMVYGPAMPAVGQHRFDNVFVNPAAYQAFKASGSWPDKTVMVLEVRNAGQEVSINKAGHMQLEVAAIELHVKDTAKGGWAFYGVNAKGATSKLPDNSACHACHEKSGAVDTTFVQFYPTLIEVAKKAGTLQPGK